MAKKYSQKELLKIIEEATKEMQTFYKEPFVNYRGKNDNGEYSETIAAYLIENGNLFNNIKTISRDNPYIVKHKDTGKDYSNRDEEILAKSMFQNGKLYDYLGKIIDYQTPLKQEQKDAAGKIDLLSWNEDDSKLYLIELKKEENKETLLRCVLEIFTYYKIVDKDKLLKDFGIRDDARIVPAVLVFKDKIQHQQYSSELMQKLMKNLGVELFIIDKDRILLP